MPSDAADDIGAHRHDDSVFLYAFDLIALD